MVKQDTENQYDDDLTLGTDEYDDSYYTDADDLFEFSTNDESPISRLKSLVLSIDWEITDEVLLQFNEELMDLKGIWADNSINLVYVQALEKISKYIYQNKANSHPNSIKLLLTLYYNLEKIVSSQDLSEAQKKEILLEDVKRFEVLKRQIAQKSKPVHEPPPPRPEVVQVKKEEAGEDTLLNLKAIVLGIDWEITDQDLNDLRREVIRLEEQFADSRPKLILLQGIGTLGAYIKTKKSNSHADAFKVLHLFYESLEKIVQTPMSLAEEKSILFPAVEQFNLFKELLGPTISPEAINRKDEEEEEEDEDEDEKYAEGASGEIAPALADISDEEAVGFQAEEEAKSLGFDAGTGGVASHIDDFFGENFAPAAEETGVSTPAEPADMDQVLGEEEVISVLGFEDDAAAVLPSVERDIALQGVDVEADDEEVSGPVAIAFGGGDEDAVAGRRGEMAGDAAESVQLALEDEQPVETVLSDEEVSRAAEALFAENETESPQAVPDFGELDRSAALKGVDVETEADEDSDEISLPMEGEELAPALGAGDEESIFSAETLESTIASGGIGEELGGTLDDLFLEEEQIHTFADVETAIEEETAERAFCPAEGAEDTTIFVQVGGEAAEKPGEITGTPWEPEFAETGVDEVEVAEPLQEQEEELSLFFSESDLEQGGEESAEAETLFESLEPAIAGEEEEGIAAVAADEQIDAFFDFEKVPEEPGEEQPVVAPVAEEVSTEAEASPYVAEEIFEEEEVVFELAEGPVEAVSVAAASTDRIIAVEEPEVESADEVAASLPPVFVEADRGDTILAFTATEFISDTRETPGDPLDGLRTCVESLGIELDDKVILGLFQEINSLRQKWSDKPLEKTFLQLLSTVTQHIDQYRYEASSDAFNLLQSVCKALAERNDDIRFSQELLLTETLKVLEWQQGMLARQAVRKGAQLTFAAPVRTEDEATDMFFEPKTELSREAFAHELKQEIASLRLTLQKEIAELRSELKGM